MSDETFIGMSLPAETYDDLAFRLIRKDWIQDEPGLFATKWFDYRFMHPAKATYLYAHHFEKGFRAAYAVNIDATKAEHVTVFKKTNVFNCDRTTVSGLWRGRQIADALGMPYDLFVQLAFAELLRFWKQKYLPRPAHLYKEELIERVRLLWEERQTSRLYIGGHQAFLAVNYQGLPVQDAHREWLKCQAMKRANPEPIFERFVKQGLMENDFLAAA